MGLGFTDLADVGGGLQIACLGDDGIGGDAGGAGACGAAMDGVIVAGDGTEDATIGGGECYCDVVGHLGSKV